MALGAGSQPVVTKWVLDNKGVLVNVAKQAKAIRLEQKAERELALVSKKLGLVQKDVAKSTKKMSGSMAKAGVVAAGVVGVMTKLTAVMGDAVKQALDYEDWIGKDTEAIKGMRRASAGLISDLDLMKARTRLLNGDFKLTEKQLQAVTKATIHYTRVNKTEFAESLKKVTDVIVRGSSRGLKDLGINMDLLGKATVKTGDAVRMITGRFGDMDVQALNTNERLDQTKNAFKNIVGQIGAAILQSDAFVRAMKKMAGAARTILEAVERSSGARGKKHAQKLELDQIDREIARNERTMGPLGFKGGRTKGALEENLAKAGGLGSYLFTRWRDFRVVDRKNRLKELRKRRKEIRADFKKTDDEVVADINRRQPWPVGKMGGWAGWPNAAPGVKTSKGSSGRRGRRSTGPKKSAFEREFGGFLGPKTEAPKTLEQLGVADSPKIAQVMDNETVALDAATIAAKKHADAMKEIADSLKPVAMGYEKAEAAARAEAAAVREATAASSEADATIGAMVSGSLAGLAGGMWAAADAAITSGDAFGAAVAKMVKATLLGVAQQATVLAAMEVAKGVAALAGVVTAPLAAGYFAAAAKFGAVAAIAGVGGLAMGAAGVGGGGGGARSTGSSTAAAPSSKVFAKEVVDKRPQFINVYIGDPNSRSAALLMQKELKVGLAT